MYRFGILILATAILAGCQSIDRGNFPPFKRSLNNTSYGYGLIEDPTGSAPGPLVERFEVQPGDCGWDSGWSDCKNDRERSELSQTSGRHGPGQTYWYSWSIYFPEDYPNVFPTKVALGQFHQVKSHPLWMFQNSSGGYNLDRQVFGVSSDQFELIPEEELRGRWHDIVLNVKWHPKGEGFFKVWVNGEQKADFEGTTSRFKGLYFKYGIYRSFMSRYQQDRNVDSTPAQVVYYANVRRASSREELELQPLAAN